MGGPLKKTIDLFRHGGFATVDEFSSLAGRNFQGDVQNLKQLLRFALSLRDPENNFHESDYYRFIQRLFHKKLFPLRNDVCVLTFNYDPYLPYLLQKAYQVRCKMTEHQQSEAAVDALTSGFSQRMVGALEDGDDLCVLQLHGAIAWARQFEGESTIWYNDLFNTPIGSRIEKLCFSEAASSPPPILFPWLG